MIHRRRESKGMKRKLEQDVDCDAERLDVEKVEGRPRKRREGCDPKRGNLSLTWLNHACDAICSTGGRLFGLVEG
jgi:hypothetical protein